MTDLEIRTFELRAGDKPMTVFGIAVPYETETELGNGFKEVIRKGAVQPRDNVKLYNEHREVVGKVTEWRNTDEAMEIAEAVISDTAAGRDAYTLVRDGVVTSFSIGFRSLDDEVDGDTIYRNKIDVKEVSLTAMPVYETAAITGFRNEDSAQADPVAAGADAPQKENESEVIVTDLITAEEANELRSANEVMERRLALLENAPKDEDNAAPQVRSASALLKDMINGDESAATEYRAYTGGTSADTLVGDTLKNAWVGDLTKIVDDSTSLVNVFAKETLPGTGNHVEYGRFTVSSIATAATGVGTQAAEGDDLRKMENLKFALDTTAVVTVGGYFSLTRQEVERSPQNVIARHQEVQAIALGKDLESKVRTAFNAARTANAAEALTVADGDTWADWQAAVIDAAVLYKGLGFSDFSLVVSVDVFKRLAAMSDITTGKPVLDQNSGRVNARGLNGEIFSVPVVVDLLETNSDRATFVVADAIRIYRNGVTKLQDANIINLSADFSLYQYVAVAPEHAYLIIPVTVGA